MSLSTNLQGLATRIAAECRAIRSHLADGFGSLTSANAWTGTQTFAGQVAVEGPLTVSDHVSLTSGLSVGSPDGSAATLSGIAGVAATGTTGAGVTGSSGSGRGGSFTSATNIALVGDSTAGTSHGVSGSANGGIGVVGSSASNYGGHFSSTGGTGLFASSLQVGTGGATVKRILTASVAHNFGATPAHAMSAEAVFTVTGAQVGDFIVVSPSYGFGVTPARMVGRVSATNSVGVRMLNAATSAYDPGEEIIRILVMKF